MPRAADNQTNFTAGEIAPRLFGRVDIGKYKNGFEKGKWTTLFSNGQYKEIKNLKIIKKKSKANDVVLKGRVHQMSVKHGKYEAYSARDYQLVENGIYKNVKL